MFRPLQHAALVGFGCASPVVAWASPAERVEASFGQSLVFVDQGVLSQAGPQKRTVPASSALFLLEYRLWPSFGPMAMGNVPLSTVRKLNQDDVFIDEYIAIALALGVRWSPVAIALTEKATFEPQLGLLIGRTFGSTLEDRFFPLLATRMHVALTDGLCLYMGGAYSFHADTLTLLYGVGHRF